MKNKTTEKKGRIKYEKVLTGILLAVLVLALAACGTKKDSEDKNTSGANKEPLKKQKSLSVHLIHRTQSF